MVLRTAVFVASLVCADGDTTTLGQRMLKRHMKKHRRELAASRQESLDNCLGYSYGYGGRCDEDVPICLQLLTKDGTKPLTWDGAGDFWNITATESLRWEDRIRNNQGHSWCVTMPLFSRVIERIGCASASLSCNASDVKKYRSLTSDKYSLNGFDITLAVGCLDQKCKTSGRYENFRDPDSEEAERRQNEQKQMEKYVSIRNDLKRDREEELRKRILDPDAPRPKIHGYQAKKRKLEGQDPSDGIMGWKTHVESLDPISFKWLREQRRMGLDPRKEKRKWIKKARELGLDPKKEISKTSEVQSMSVVAPWQRTSQAHDAFWELDKEKFTRAQGLSDDVSMWYWGTNYGLRLLGIVTAGGVVGLSAFSAAALLRRPGSMSIVPLLG